MKSISSYWFFKHRFSSVFLLHPHGGQGLHSFCWLVKCLSGHSSIHSPSNKTVGFSPSLSQDRHISFTKGSHVRQEGLHKQSYGVGPLQSCRQISLQQLGAYIVLPVLHTEQSSYASSVQVRQLLLHGLHSLELYPS